LPRPAKAEELKKKHDAVKAISHNFNNVFIRVFL